MATLEKQPASSNLELFGSERPFPEQTNRTGKELLELITRLDQELKKAKGDRTPFERQWYQNLAFYFGKQWSQWVGQDYAFARLVESKPFPWQVRLTTNLIRPACRREVAKLNAERPRGFVVPSGSDDDDIAAARAAETIHTYVTDSVIKLPLLMRRVDFWTVVTGTGFLKVWWDASAPDPSIPDEPQPTDPSTNPISMQPTQSVGLIRSEAVSPFHIFVPNLEIEDMDAQPWVMHVSVQDPLEIMRIYGVPLPADHNMTTDIIEDKMLRVANITQQSARRGVLVKECWIRPNTNFPNGAVIVWAGQTLLYIQEHLPYDHMQYPFTKRSHIETGRFYAEGLVTDLIPLQIEYNKSRSQVIENKNLTTRPQMVAAKGSIQPERWTSQPGLVIQYQPGFDKPEPLPISPLPSYVQTNIDTIRSDMAEIASQHEVSKGEAAGRVEAATAIAYLQERDDSLVSFSVLDREYAWERVGQQCLALVGQFWDVPRMVRVTGRNEVFEAYLFDKSDMHGNTDWRVVEGSGFPVSRAAKQAQLMELMKMGVLPPDKALQYMKMGETAKLYEELNIGARHAERENVRMAAGEETRVNDFDDDLTHIQIHDDYRRRQEYETMAQPIKDMIRYHVFVHLKQLATKFGIPLQVPMMQQQQAQQLVGPDGAPMPPTPQPGQINPDGTPNPFFVDEMQEMELRSIYTSIVNGGMQQGAAPNGGQ